MAQFEFAASMTGISRSVRGDIISVHAADRKEALPSYFAGAASTIDFICDSPCSKLPPIVVSILVEAPTVMSVKLYFPDMPHVTLDMSSLGLSATSAAEVPQDFRDSATSPAAVALARQPWPRRL